MSISQQSLSPIPALQGFFAKSKGGGGFIFASLKIYHEKTPTLEIGSSVISHISRGNKIQGQKFAKTPTVGGWGVSRETPVLHTLINLWSFVFIWSILTLITMAILGKFTASNSASAKDWLLGMKNQIFI